MAKEILKKYGIWIVVYIGILSCFYTLGIKTLSIYFNYFLYFLTFILIVENYRNSKLNRDIILLFKYFYFYNSCVLIFYLGALLINNPSLNLISFLYTDIGQSSFILMISIFLFIKSLNIKFNNTYKMIIISAAITLLLTFINYYKFILTPESYGSLKELYVIKKYLFNLICIVLLLVFWIRYYNKFFVLSEYLTIILFLFLLSNILDALHFIAFKHDFQLFAYGLYIFLALNTFIVVLWYIRLGYLNTELAKENEKYLANYQFLEGLVNKPKQSTFQTFFVSLSPNYLVLFLVLLILGIFTLYMARFINLYLMINTIFIIVTTLLAVFYSFSSIKRDWTNQFSFMLKNKKKEKV